MITRSQLRMARAALGWGVRDLGQRAGVAANTVSRYENGMGTTVATLGQIQRVLESEGIVFIPADDTGGPGVRLRERKEDDWEMARPQRLDSSSRGLQEDRRDE
jgi:transcriptional regulator with XRE-family HTH domain